MNANNEQNSQQQAIAKIIAFDSKGINSASHRQWKGVFWSIGLVILMSLSLLACKGPQEQPPQTADTAGLAAFQAQKLADSLAAVNPEAIEQSQGQGEIADQGNGSSSNSAADADYEAEDGYSKSDNNVAGNTMDDGSGGAIDETANNDVTETEAPVKKKKKFSNAGKDALIGAGSGAILGAVISKKNRGLGAVIGAAVGGGAGYGIGKHKDNKEKRESE